MRRRQGLGGRNGGKGGELGVTGWCGGYHRSLLGTVELADIVR